MSQFFTPRFYQILMIVVFAYICSVGVYVTWGLYQIEISNNKIEWFYYTLNDTVYKLKIASTEAEQIKGLSGIKKKPDHYDGMFFTFKNKQIMAFHNNNVHLDLDVLWLDDFKIVGQDELSAQSKSGLQIITPSKPVNYVIELFK